MKNIQNVIFYLASAIGIWLLASFGGAMLDSANAALWSRSLMWALLSFLIVMPALALMSDLPFTRKQDADSSSAADPSFVDRETSQTDARQHDDESGWPSSESHDTKEVSHA